MDPRLVRPGYPLGGKGSRPQVRRSPIFADVMHSVSIPASRGRQSIPDGDRQESGGFSDAAVRLVGRVATGLVVTPTRTCRSPISSEHAEFPDPCQRTVTAKCAQREDTRHRTWRVLCSRTNPTVLSASHARYRPKVFASEAREKADDLVVYRDPVAVGLREGVVE